MFPAPLRTGEATVVHAGGMTMVFARTPSTGTPAALPGWAGHGGGRPSLPGRECCWRYFPVRVSGRVSLLCDVLFSSREVGSVSGGQES